MPDAPIICWCRQINYILIWLHNSSTQVELGTSNLSPLFSPQQLEIPTVITGSASWALIYLNPLIFVLCFIPGGPLWWWGRRWRGLHQRHHTFNSRCVEESAMRTHTSSPHHHTFIPSQPWLCSVRAPCHLVIVVSPLHRICLLA
jgi:hypothetical protein